MTAKPISRFVAAAVLVPLLLLAIAGWHDLAQLQQAAQERGARTATALAEHAKRVIESQDSALRQVEDRIAGRTDDELRSSQELHRWLVRLARDTEYIIAISIVGADGRSVASSLGFPLPPVDAGDREYFRALKQNPEAEYHINEPIIGRPTGEPVFQYARRRNGPDGRFAGVVVASVRPEAFARFYREVAGKGDAVTLARADGAVLVREPSVTTGLEKLPAASGLMQSVAADPRAGFYRTTSHLDRVDRLHAYRKAGEWPVYVSYGHSIAGIHAQWRRDLLLYGSAAGAGALLLLLIGSVALRRARSEEAALVRAREADALRLSEARMAAVLEGMSDGYCALDRDWRITAFNGASERYYGIARDAVIGRDFWEVFPAGRGSLFEEKYRQVMEARASVAFEAVSHTSSGRIVEVRAAPTPDGGMAIVFTDVTERRQAEAAVRCAEERYRLALRATGEAIWDWDFATDRVEWSVGMQANFGHAVDVIAGSGDWWASQIHPDDRERVNSSMLGAIGGTDEIWGEDYRFRRADGSYAYVADRAHIARDESGRATRMVGAMLDLSDRRAIEEALRASEERLRDITDAMPVLISYVDAEQRFQFVNRAYEEWFGRPRAEIAGRSLCDVMSEAMYAARRPYVEQALAGRFVTYETVFPHRDGPRTTNVQHIPHVGPNGDVLGMYALVQDLTQLVESQAQLRLAIDAARMAIFEIDTVKDELTYSPELSRLLGFAPDYRVTLAEVRTRYLPGEQERMQEAARAALLSGEKFGEIEWGYRHPDGTAHWLLLRAQVKVDAAGNPVRYVGVLLDVTERRRWAEHQQLLINELNHRVKNTLAIVQGLAHQTFKGAAATPEARAAFEGRLTAMAAAHNVLTQENWESASLRVMIGDVVAPYKDRPDRFAFDGPELRLPPKTAVSLAMAVHELATNAAKYGGLSRPEGSVEVRWQLEEGRLRLAWQERGGPTVNPPVRRGFGTRMIERGLAAELNGQVTIDFRAEGVRCTIDAPHAAPNA